MSSTKTFDQIKQEMQARLTELKPLIEEAAVLEAILAVDTGRSVEDTPERTARTADTQGRRQRSTKRDITHGFNSFEHRVNSYYKRMREDLPPYFTIGAFSNVAVFDQRNQEAMAAFEYLIDHGYVQRLEVNDVAHGARPHGWWLASNLYAVVDKNSKVQFNKEGAAIG